MSNYRIFTDDEILEIQKEYEELRETMSKTRAIDELAEKKYCSAKTIIPHVEPSWASVRKCK